MIPLFVGYDDRESAVFHVFNQTVLDRTSVPVSITPLHVDMLDGFDGQRDGTNRFIFSRFLVPHLMCYQGFAIFVDGDMVLRSDLKNLWNLRDPSKAVQVVQHDYVTQHRRKFINTPIENDNVHYPRKNWSSVIIWNCGHPKNRILTPDIVSAADPKWLHRFLWLEDAEIGALQEEWNHLVTEQQGDNAKLAHFTLGAPGFEHYIHCKYSAEWHKSLMRVLTMVGEDPIDMVTRSFRNSDGIAVIGGASSRS